MAISFQSILSGITAANSTSGAVGALLSTLTGALGSSNTVVASALAKFQNIQLNADNPTRVGTLCEQIQDLDNVGSGAPVAVIYASKIQGLAASPTFNPVIIMDLASQAVALLNSSNTSGNIASQLSSLSGTITSAIAAKPVA